MNAVEWNGPTCLMCNGTGVDHSYRAVSEPNSAGVVEVVRDVPTDLPCRACNGHGCDADVPTYSPAPEPEVVTKTSGETVDLLAALQRSLDAAKAARPVSSPASPAGGESDG